MKILGRLLLLCPCLFFCLSAQAGQNEITVTYPAAGAYKQLTFSTPSNYATTSLACNANNLGLIYYDNVSNSLQICANIDGTPTVIPYNQTCFNIYCSSNTGTPCYNLEPAPPSAGSTTYCPDINGVQYYQVNQANIDTFVVNGYKVYSVVCCSQGMVNAVTAPQL